MRNAPRARADPRGLPRRRAWLRAAGWSAWPPPAPVAQAATGGGLSAGGDRDERRPGPQPAGADRPGRRAEGLRVMIVEDEAVISMEIEDMLEALGCTVVGVAHAAEEALRLAERERPDLVTMDVRLPGPADGVTAATELFDRYGLRALFITAYTDPETVARAGPARPLGWLRKPLTVRGLAAAIENLPDPDEG